MYWDFKLQSDWWFVSNSSTPCPFELLLDSGDGSSASNHGLEELEEELAHAISAIVVLAGSKGEDFGGFTASPESFAFLDFPKVTDRGRFKLSLSGCNLLKVDGYSFILLKKFNLRSLLIC